MKIRSSALALAATAATMVGAALPATAEAQWGRRPVQRQSFTPPGSNVHIYPAPRYGFRVGGATIYPAPHSRFWGYGPPAGYAWPYGYPSGYVSPFGTTTYVYPSPSYHRPRHWR